MWRWRQTSEYKQKQKPRDSEDCHQTTESQERGMEQVCLIQFSGLVASRTVRQQLSHPFCTLLWQLQKSTILTIDNSSLLNILCDILLISISDSSYFFYFILFYLLFDIEVCGVLFSHVYVVHRHLLGWFGDYGNFSFFSYVI